MIAGPNRIPFYLGSGGGRAGISWSGRNREPWIIYKQNENWCCKYLKRLQNFLAPMRLSWEYEEYFLEFSF